MVHKSIREQKVNGKINDVINTKFVELEQLCSLDDLDVSPPLSLSVTLLVDLAGGWKHVHWCSLSFEETHIVSTSHWSRCSSSHSHKLFHTMCTCLQNNGIDLCITQLVDFHKLIKNDFTG